MCEKMHSEITEGMGPGPAFGAENTGCGSPERFSLAGAVCEALVPETHP